jgi:hypothetical protein
MIDLIKAARPQPDEAVKPLVVQLIEMAQLRAFRGIGPRYYLSAGLNSRGVRSEEVRGHINAEEYRRFVRLANPPEQRNPLNSKIEQKRRLLAAGIPTPRPIYAAESGAADPVALEAALRDHDGQRIAVKLVSGFAGQGFRSFTVRVSDSVTLVDSTDGRITSPSELVASMDGGLVVETYLRQHDWYDRLNPSSVNTWRVWVMKSGPSDGAQVVLAYLRMGRAGSPVDNMGGGGLYAPLREDGSLGAAGDGGIFRRRFVSHPDSGVPIENVRPPLVAEAIALAERTLDAIPALTFAGMDIAVGVDGPAVIEINAEPDRMGAARVGLPFRHWLDERGIRP